MEKSSILLTILIRLIICVKFVLLKLMDSYRDQIKTEYVDLMKRFNENPDEIMQTLFSFDSRLKPHAPSMSPGHSFQYNGEVSQSKY